MQNDPKATGGGVSRRDAVVLAAAAVLLGRALGAPGELVGGTVGAGSVLQYKFYAAVDRESSKLLYAGELPDEVSRTVLERPELVQLKIFEGAGDRAKQLGSIALSELIEGAR